MDDDVKLHVNDHNEVRLDCLNGVWSDKDGPVIRGMLIRGMFAHDVEFSGHNIFRRPYDV